MAHSETEVDVDPQVSEAIALGPREQKEGLTRTLLFSAILCYASYIPCMSLLSFSCLSSLSF